MECPFCYTNFEFDLSICPSCGKDTSDPIYHELFSSVKPRIIEKAVETEPVSDFVPELSAQIAQEITPAVVKTGPREKPAVTAAIRSKNTCNTLVDFPAKKAELPEWRLELQSRMRDIKGQKSHAVGTVRTEAVASSRHAIGATGLAMAVLEAPPVPVVPTHPIMQRALERIERSRLKNEQIDPEPVRNYQTDFETTFTARKPGRIITEEEALEKKRFFIHSENETVEDRLPQIEQSFATKLAQATELRNGLCGEKFSTNKLRKLEYGAQFSGTATAVAGEPEILELEETDLEAAAFLVIEEKIAEVSFQEDEPEEIAPFAFRFNAGLFDFIISSFISLIILSPFVLMGGTWFSFEGVLAFLVTCTVVMFSYITVSVGLIGRTLGMGLFSLEMIDIEDNDYPSFNQAAVSSSIYLASLALGGIGFATMFWNDEKRAVHDLVSGTVVIREG